MCGICGIVAEHGIQPPDVNTVRKMMGRLSHRGPDSSGYYHDRRALLGHTRLAIIDLEGGIQPIPNEDETLWVIFNGEIYNYIELGNELKRHGHTIKTKSDTEIIVHAYEEWGTDCFQRFNGQWAFALWDTRKKRLILSRDRLGIRPLYYTIVKNRLLFASEIKALFADRSIPRSLDPAGLNEIFTFWSPVAPRTAFTGIKEVQPGHFAVFQNKQITERPYWTIDFPQRGKTEEQPLQENAGILRRLLIEAARLRFLRSDVPVGAYLSGGIDSSLTSALITNYTDVPLKTFSIRFTDSEFDEGMYQHEMVQRLKTLHRDIAVSPHAIGEIFPDVIWHTERPILRTAPAPLFLLSKLVHESGYKVVVTGEGSDEVLAGYDIFRETMVRRFIARDPSSEKRISVLKRLYPWMARSPGEIPAFAKAFFMKDYDIADPGFSHYPRWGTASLIKMMLQPDFRVEVEKADVVGELFSRLPESHNSWAPLNRAQWLEYVTLLSGYILSAQGDRMLMAHSVEGRFPFLDHTLVDFSNGLPPRQKLLALDEKHILKKAFKDLIPHSILNRPKQPYRAPDAASFFTGDRLKWVSELTEEESLKNAGVFNPKAVSKLVAKCKKNSGNKMSNADNMRIVGILSTMLTFHHFIANDGAGKSTEIPPEPMTVFERST